MGLLHHQVTALVTVSGWRAETASRYLHRPSRVLVKAVRRDLDSGTWDARHAHRRTMAEYDAGLRLLISTPHD